MPRAPSGWTPWVTIGSWFGSPMRTIDRAQRPDRDRVGERHLARLVDEQDVEGAVELGTGEQPAGPGDDVDGPGGEGVADFAVARRPGSRPRGAPTWPSSSSAFWMARTATPLLGRGRDHGLEEVADRLVGLRGDRDALLPTDEVDDHARPGDRSCPSRAAPGSAARRGPARAPAVGPHRGHPRRARRAASPAGGPARGQPEEHVADRAIGPRAVDAVGDRPHRRRAASPASGRCCRAARWR